MPHGPTVYDEVQYPSALYRTTHPEHLAAIARLHGLGAADPRRARVLEIAGGDGLNVMAMAAALPDAQFVNIDLAPSAIARGQQLAAACGLANARIEVADVIAAAETCADDWGGAFDYVIAHGLYAWVPPAVQRATLRLIDRVLAPEGVAYISYNAMPGGYLRMALRDMLLYEMGDTTEDAGNDEDRARQAMAILGDYGRDRDSDTLEQAALRRMARRMTDKDLHFLFHDELGAVYDPKALHRIVAEAGAHNLAYLTEAQPGGLFHGMPGEALDDDAVVRRAQIADYRDLCFFHQSLFVRPGRAPLRVPDWRVFETLLAGVPAGLARTGPREFKMANNTFEIGDATLADFMELMIRRAPARLPLAAFAQSPEHGEAILRLVDRGILELHSLPFPGALDAGERPRANALLRALIAQGETRLFTLDHRAIAIDEEGPRLFLSLLDGSRDRAELTREWERSGRPEQTDVTSALRQFARAGMLSE
ncbi:class I SAM-dependent methyltransferase [Novosphingobium resinovorum]|uniref:class I SAM-dependent methyltransferase n=1 Tax=Novosphingobium resinovorum TaxID=158500 RepID=UPI002ECFC11B|nr:class I SAM-dependent methyltransferase [Novosphingobium resinovorum]